MADDHDRDVSYHLGVPDEWKVGVYANEVSVWHTPYEFTLDFAVTESPAIDDPDDPESPLTLNSTVVARVRIPVGLIFGVLQAVNAAMTAYEESWGTIKGPEWQGRSEESE